MEASLAGATPVRSTSSFYLLVSSVGKCEPCVMVQEQSAATAAYDTDPIRPPMSCELRKRPLLTALHLNGKEKVVNDRPTTSSHRGVRGKRLQTYRNGSR